MLPKFVNFYEERQQISGYENWNQFSVIHSTPGNQFNFIAYNGSHRLKNDQTLNLSTRTKIRFPKNGSYFIVFHGRLIHSGDKSILTYDNKIEPSTRLFSYLTVPVHNVIASSTRSSKRLTTYTTNTKENTVDTTSFKFNVNKFRCNDIECVINLPPNNYKKTDKYIIPVVGNMKENGWEVYNGVDFGSYLTKGIKKDLSYLLSKHQIEIQQNNANKSYWF